MRAVRSPRGQNGPSGSYLPLRSAGATSNRVNPMRRMNARFRYAILICLLIAFIILVINVIIIRWERPHAILKLTGRSQEVDEFSHMEPDDAILERLRYGNHKAVRLPQKIVHLDLKGAPLKISYLRQVMPLLRRMGATGLLIEYEDMFPYYGSLSNLSAENSYTKHDIRSLLDSARANELSVIPLIQTFGHLEFALKLEEFINLREVYHNPQALCPSRNGSVLLVRTMLKQIEELHRGYISHIHIGSDEVFALGECDSCMKRMEEHQWTKSDLFMAHVDSVVEIVRGMGLQPIIWDDMFRPVDEEALTKSALAKLVDVMVWNYSKNVNLVGVFGKYVTAGFRGIWIASSFKGALSPNNQMPEFKLHLLNHHSWIQLLKQFEDKIQVKGIAITGWQRFDHFGALCELFPVGLPVLVVCLAYLQTGKLDDKVLNDVSIALNCSRRFHLSEESRSSLSSVPLMSQLLLESCHYPGSRVFADIQQWNELKQRQKQMLATNYIVGWMGPMNCKKKFSSPEHVMQGTRDLSELIQQAARIRKLVSMDFAEVTDEATVAEWLESFLEPLEISFESLQKNAYELLSRNVWPRRPLH